MTRLHPSIALGLALVLSLPVIAAATRPSAALSCGILPYTEVALNRRAQSTASREFVDVIGSALSLRTRETTCIVIQFSADIAAAGDGSVMPVMLRAVRNDGTEDVANVEGPIQFLVTSGALSDGRSYGLLLPAVPPGSHTVRMQYRTRGDTISLKSFNMNVRYGR